MQHGTRGNPNARILIVGECFSSEDDRQGVAFGGSTGKEIDQLLIEAGIDSENCYFTNVVNKKPPRGRITDFFVETVYAKKAGLTPVKGLYPAEEIYDGLRLLEELIAKLQPTVIIAMGDYALWALTKDSYKIINGSKARGNAGYKIPTGITKFRGSQLRSDPHNIPLLPVYHPWVIRKNYPWRMLVVHDLQARVKKAFRNDWQEPERNYIIRPSFEVAMETMTELLMRATVSEKPLMLSVDIETSQAFVECVGISWSMHDALCIPIMCADKWDGYWSPEEEVAIILMLKQLLEHQNIMVIGQNFFYDYQYFWFFYNIKPTYGQDTMLAHHVCFPGTLMGLDYLSSLYCSFHKYWKDDGKEASKEHNDEQRWIYNCRDCVVTYEIMVELWKLIEHYRLQRQFAIQMVRAHSAIGMMIRGVAIDEKRRGEEKLIHMETAMDMENFLESSLPENVFPRDRKKTAWYRSNQQLGMLFYEVLGLAEIKAHKTGNATVDDEALSKIKHREPLLTPLVNTLQQYRSLETFGGFLNMKVGKDGRMRANFSPTTETFRYRSSADVFGTGRNLQNLPVGTEED